MVRTASLLGPIILLLIFGNPNRGMAQSDTLSPGKSSHGKVGFETSFFSGSTGLTSAFVRDLFFNRFIDDPEKDANPLRNQNLYGGEYSRRLFYSDWNSDTSGLKSRMWTIGFTDRSLAETRFTKDYFDLVFKGNASFAGQTAHLSDFRFLFMRVQSMDFEFQKSREFEKGCFSWSVNLGFLKGQRMVEAVFNKAELYTQADGEYLDFLVDYRYHSSDTARHGLQDFNGTGIQANVIMEWTDKSRTWDFQAGVRGFGQIWWNNASLKTRADTAFRFSGSEVSSILDLSSAHFNSFSRDSLLDDFYYSKTQMGGIASPLPYDIFLAGTVALNPHLRAGLKMEKRMTSFVVPLKTTLLIEWNPGPFTRFDFSMSHGGFTTWQAGFGVSHVFRDRWEVRLASENPAGFLFPDHLLSTSLALGISFHFQKRRPGHFPQQESGSQLPR